MSLLKLDTLARDNGDVQIILKAGDGETRGSSQMCAVCTHCNKEIVAPIYIKADPNSVNMDGKSFHKQCLPWFLSKKKRSKQDNNVECGTKEEQKKKKNAKLSQLWNDFLGSCTLHGFHYCFDGELPLRRVLWTLLLIGAFAVFFEKCTDSVISFFEYPFTTTTLLQYEDRLDFPAVSVCNYNDARRSKMNGTTLDKMLRAKMNGEDYKKYHVPGKEMQETLASAAHSLSDMIISCKWKEKEQESRCLNNFTSFKNANGDVCFMFNSPKKGVPVLKIDNTGEKKGLDLTIDIQHFDYYFGISNAGFKVILHDPLETPAKMQGYSVPPGFTTYFSLRKKVITNLPDPYKTKCAMPGLKYFDTRYTKSKCFLDRLTQYVLRKCGCRDWFMPGDSDVCSFDLLSTCAWPAWVHFENNKLDKCPVACKNIEYSATLSYALYPSNVEADQLAKKRKLTGSLMENRQFLRENLMQIKLYYEDLTYFDVKQTPSYDMYSLLGDVGGQIGLFLGASCLTVVEYIDFLVTALYIKYSKRV